MTEKHNSGTTSSLYVEAQAAIAKTQAENAELRAKCNMPPSLDDCQPALQRLYDGTLAESDAMQNGYEARIEELTVSIAKLQNIITQMAGSGNIPKLGDSTLRHDDYYAISDYLDAQRNDSRPSRAGTRPIQTHVAPRLVLERFAHPQVARPIPSVASHLVPNGVAQPP